MVVGGMAGGIVGVIVAVNVVIFSGIERGYESSLEEVFRYNAAVGVLVVALWVVGPVLGVIAARRRRR